jgi:hypothetical protein
MKKIMLFVLLYVNSYTHAQPQISTQNALFAMQRSMDMNKSIPDMNLIFPIQDTIYYVSANGMDGRFHVVENGDVAIKVFKNFIWSDSIQAYNTEATMKMVAAINETNRIACNIENHFLYTASTFKPNLSSNQPVRNSDVAGANFRKPGFYWTVAFLLVMFLAVSFFRFRRQRKILLENNILSTTVKQKEAYESWLGI